MTALDLLKGGTDECLRCAQADVAAGAGAGPSAGAGAGGGTQAGAGTPAATSVTRSAQRESVGSSPSFFLGDTHDQEEEDDDEGEGESSSTGVLSFFLRS